MHQNLDYQNFIVESKEEVTGKRNFIVLNRTGSEYVSQSV